MKKFGFLKKNRVFAKYDIKNTEYHINQKLRLSILEVTDTYELLDSLVENEIRNQSVERFPYWAEIWPSSIGLVKWFFNNQRKIGQKDGWIRELGCGVGFVGVALGAMGWTVESTDYVEDALVFTSENAKINKIGFNHRVAYLDWRNPVGKVCNCLVGSDIIYEKKNHLILSRLLDAILSRGGHFYTSDPQRVASRTFVDIIRKKGYQHQVDVVKITHGSLKHDIDIHQFIKP